MEPPAIDTERLSLRGPRVEDFDDSFAMWSNENVARQIGMKPSSREEAWSRLLRYAGHWTLLGYGFWVVRERVSGRFVGEVGVGDFHRDIVPSLGEGKEAGWALAPWAHGKGLATEAMRAVLAWVNGTFGRERMVCIINPANAASLRVAEKCGFREFARGAYKGDPTVMLERLAD